MKRLSRIDRAILAVSPSWAARRAQARYRVAAYSGAYEATQSTRLRKHARDWGDGNAVAQGAQVPLRDMARNLDRNHDISRGILNVLVRNVVGAHGIGVLPQPRDANGNVIDSLAQQLSDLWEAWSRAPEVTGEFNRARAEQLACRSWFRDGEALCQYVEGNVPGLTHATAVPFSLEYLESDMVPGDYNDPSRNIVQGVECDAWNRPKTYYVYKQHPGARLTAYPELKPVPTSVIGHIKLVDRFGMRRGVSMFASVLTRLDDLKDYEESERIAAKIAASFAAFIKKGMPEEYAAPPDGSAPRHMHLQPGMVFDDLKVGEEIGTIDSKRPNPNAATWRDGQLRAVAAGADVSYSSSSKNYNGTYSAQRQELVEQWEAYRLLSQAFIDQHTSEVYIRFVAMCVLAGLVKIPRGATFNGIAHALYIPPAMPWIDPVKEATGWELREKNRWVSGSEIV
ncbi:MAG TPA: phage portal protein, partial [Frateuria sp.]|uniref:phage portal protein n=1 Tax=Frateuria sp. TaxID=2211372 RepID=UPI002D8110ED